MVSKNEPFFTDRGRLALSLEFLAGCNIIVLEFVASSHCVWLYCHHARALIEAQLVRLQHALASHITATYVNTIHMLS
jgi:hypothetical protein